MGANFSDLSSKDNEMNCDICGSHVDKFIEYDYHVFSIKGFVKKILPYFRFVIPIFLTRLRRIASRKIIFKGDIGICTNCGYGILIDIPSADKISHYYSHTFATSRVYEDTRKKKDIIDLGTKDDYKKNVRAVNQINLIQDHISLNHNSNILEIGGGGSYPLLLLRDMYNNNNINVCEAGVLWEEYYHKLKINIASNYFPFKSKKKFDYIHTSHWLEHVDNLNLTINSIYDLLNPDGYFFIEVPSSDCLYWKKPILDTPHIQFFTKECLKIILEKNNFKCLHIDTYGPSVDDVFLNIKVDNAKVNKNGAAIKAIFQKNNLNNI